MRSSIPQRLPKGGSISLPNEAVALPLTRNEYQDMVSVLLGSGRMKPVSRQHAPAPPLSLAKTSPKRQQHQPMALCMSPIRRNIHLAPIVALNRHGETASSLFELDNGTSSSRSDSTKLSIVVSPIKKAYSYG